MSSYRTRFPSKYLSAEDLVGARPTVTIARIADEPVGPDQDIRPICYFRQNLKPLVCNKTNCTTIAEIVGSDDTDVWPGHHIQLYATTVSFKGETRNCIRVDAPPARRVPAPAVVAAPVAVPPVPEATDAMTEDDIPF